MLIDNNSKSFRAAALCAVLMMTAVLARAEGAWPDLASPAKAIGGGEHDSAVVVGIERYFAVPGVPGAKLNASQWYDYLTETRGIPPQNVKLLTDADATREDILGASRRAAGQAGKEGTLWFVFVGHGVPGADGKDGLLVGVDAQQKAQSLQERSVRRGELLDALAATPAGSIRVVLDACFSGRGQDGATLAPGLQPLLTVAAAGALDSRMAVLTAAKGNQFAGALPGVSRPAFSYLVLGGLRGWAPAAGGKLTAGELMSYVRNALAATLRGRDQTPDLAGPESAAMVASAGETGPSLAKLAKASSGGAIQFSVSVLPEVVQVNKPSMAALGRMPSAPRPGVMGTAEGIDFSAVDVDALGKYDETVTFEKGSAKPEEKAEKWRALGAGVKSYEEVAGKRASQWDAFAEQAAFNVVIESDKDGSAPWEKAAKWKKLAAKYPKFAEMAAARAQEWARYEMELFAAEEAKGQREDLMDRDWVKLEKLLSYSVVSAADKRKFALTFVQAYGKAPDENPYVAELAKHLPLGMVKPAPKGRSAPVFRRLTRAGKAGIKWVVIPAGKFTMGDDVSTGAQPRHAVELKSFELTQTLVTVGQYRACVEAGACTRPNPREVAVTGATINWDVPGRERHPVIAVTWQQAKEFSAWAGGRLPTEAEWEYAATSGGKDRAYPWGNEPPTCERALFKDCDKKTAAVCSMPAGNTVQGLCDMAGNVWQWLQDFHHLSYSGAPTDGSSWEEPSGPHRVVRGGGWDVEAKLLRVTNRGASEPTVTGSNFGFRIAR